MQKDLQVRSTNAPATSLLWLTSVIKDCLLYTSKVSATYCIGGAIVGEWLSASAGCLLYTSLVEMEVRELLSEYGFDGDNAPVIRGSALKALEGDPKYVDAINELMDAVDEFIPDPVRDTDKPFLMSVEDVMTITGRGTVATGRVERGVVKLGEEVEIVGIKAVSYTHLDVYKRQVL